MKKSCERIAAVLGLKEGSQNGRSGLNGNALNSSYVNTNVNSSVVKE
eukprot:CAMPEP_0185612606 /NCGR_PEP_ID=MMETSP0436-20130131/22631_1 /TAXON_ID=626734 ORGANISM="Favella taraikaensis, Strain Fe Narragansett Bay" /NCGR_SAMPLE_ID=MMETSP0436 /ASSEMBLY_ACC=CAM_ASM_000390 /LENGTH=46 /DNA_ID= /DNA_START= /DNA_END= /DNA_ORIENTATION=